jgi:hypothetical protein
MTIFRSKEPFNGKASKVKKRQKIMTEPNPEDCQVRAKITFDPSAKVRRSEGVSVSTVFVTATCPHRSNCAVTSARKGLKLCNKKKQKTDDVTKPTIT